MGIKHIAMIVVIVIAAFGFGVGWSFTMSQVQQSCRAYNGFSGLNGSYYHCTRLQ
jgi:hypothetical protein